MTARVTLKLATSLDGRIATADGESRWITGEAARRQVHALRAEHDAVLIGSDTALADDPELTVRLGDYEGQQPARVVLDSRQRLSTDSRLIRSQDRAALYLITPQTPSTALLAAGVRVVQMAEGPDGRPPPAAVFERLRQEGLSRVFVEGGGQVAASLLRDDLVDAIEWFRAPLLLGQEGRPAVGALALASLAAAPRFRRFGLEPLGEDAWERYERL